MRSAIPSENRLVVQRRDTAVPDVFNQATRVSVCGDTPQSNPSLNLRTQEDGTVQPIYLSQKQPRWTPETEGDIQVAIDQGLLEETHFLDLKREVSTGRSANKELARDLAQFAVDGGTLLIGVQEVDGSPPGLAPVELDGLSERVEQVARSAVDPPLFVTTTAIRSASNPEAGYLLVHVPASASAPHMADGTYYGRGDKVRSRLSDAEVRRLHEGQKAGRDAVRAELSAYVDRDPVPAGKRAQAHLFAVAIPAVPREEMLLSLTGSDNAHGRLYRLLQQGATLPDRLGESFSPRLTSASSLQRRSDGMALQGGLGPGRILLSGGVGQQFVEDAIEFEFGEDGALRLMTTRFSDEINEEQMLFASMMPILVRQFVGVAAAVSKEVGYGGVWALGVGATGVAGLRVHTNGGWGGDSRVSSDLELYERFTTATTSELAEEPGPVAERLTGRFLRGIGVESWSEVRAALD